MGESLAVGRMQAALGQATTELTVAAANLNFDFTLVKVEAPAEYQPLSRALTSSRKWEAESGLTHKTARRLGALFEDICPRTPNLIKSYGSRVSEIPEHDATKTKKKTPSNWIFSEYAGIDCTSLWAAATSSKAALYVHLLACMLARVWDDAEAVSIWVEIVHQRRREIAAKFERGEPVKFATTAAASQEEITRERLAKVSYDPIKHPTP